MELCLSCFRAASRFAPSRWETALFVDVINWPWCHWHTIVIYFKIFENAKFTISRVPLFSPNQKKNVQNSYLLNITFIWGGVTPVKYDCDFRDITGYFAVRWEIFIEEKFTEHDLETPIQTSIYRKDTKQGALSIRKTVLPGMAIPMLKIRRPNGRLIFNMEIAIRR